MAQRSFRYALFIRPADMIYQDIQQSADKRIGLGHFLFEHGAGDDDDGGPLGAPHRRHSGLRIDQRHFTEHPALTDGAQNRFDAVDNLDDLTSPDWTI